MVEERVGVIYREYIKENLNDFFGGRISTISGGVMN